jgi:hypothetical protein
MLEAINTFKEGLLMIDFDAVVVGPGSSSLKPP